MTNCVKKRFVKMIVGTFTMVSILLIPVSGEAAEKGNGIDVVVFANEDIEIGENQSDTITEKEEAYTEEFKNFSNPPTTTIEDSEVPLADAPEASMSWWWLIVVALLGAAGYELCRKYQFQSDENEDVK